MRTSTNSPIFRKTHEKFNCCNFKQFDQGCLRAVRHIINKSFRVLYKSVNN